METIITHVTNRREVGALCWFHKRPLIAGIQAGTGEILYACDACAQWHTAPQLVLALAIRDRRETTRIRDPRLLRRKVAPWIAPAS